MGGAVNTLKRLAPIEWIIIGVISAVLVSLVAGVYADMKKWERCRAAGGHKRYVGSATHTMLQPIIMSDGHSVYVPVQNTFSVYECQDRDGRLVDAEAP